MIDKKIVVAALARDCAEALKRNIPRLEEFVSNFREAQFVVSENDSKDETKEILARWAETDNRVKVISQDFGGKTIDDMSYSDPYPCFGRNRITKMAKFRNIYMDYIRENIDDVDYLLMIDIDIIYFDVQGMVKSINDAPADWGALFAFGKTSVTLGGIRFFDLFWDTFAYVYRDINAPITLKHIDTSHKSVARAVKKEVFHKCASAFGGMGLYRWSCIKNSHYVMEENNDVSVKAKCEHIPFNRAISSDYSLYISRHMVIDYGNTNLMVYLIRKIFPSKVIVFMSSVLRKFK